MTRYFDSSTQICLSRYNFHGATMTIEGSLQVSIAIVEAFLADCWSRIWLDHVTCK